MARSIRLIAVLSGLALLSGCSMFYPNWGATSLPEEPTSSAAEATSEPTESEPEPEQTSSTSETETAEPTETAKPEPKKIDVEILMAVVEPELKLLSVVAQVPGVSDEGGSCTFRFQSGDFDRKITVKAEPSSTYTQCYPIDVPLKDLKSGAGIVTVSYKSDLYVGTSPATSVVIP